MIGLLRRKKNNTKTIETVIVESICYDRNNQIYEVNVKDSQDNIYNLRSNGGSTVKQTKANISNGSTIFNGPIKEIPYNLVSNLFEKQYTAGTKIDIETKLQ